MVVASDGHGGRARHQRELLLSFSSGVSTEIPTSLNSAVRNEHETCPTQPLNKTSKAGTRHARCVPSLGQFLVLRISSQQRARDMPGASPHKASSQHDASPHSISSKHIICVYICIYPSTYIYIYIYIQSTLHIHSHVYMCPLYQCIYIYTYIYTDIYTNAYTGM